MEDELLAVPAEEDSAESGAMSDSELASMLESYAAQAVGTEWDEIADQQEKAINYYYRRPFGDEQAGQSQVVDGTVAVVIDNALAAVLKPFVSADDVVAFAPRGPEDEEQADQATEYVNYVFNCDNDGFLILHNWFKDALLTKLGIVKAWWEDTSHIRPETATVDAMGLMMAREDPEYAGEQDNGDGTYAASFNREVRDGRVRIEVVPPEEFKVSPFARSIETAPYAAHAPKNVTRSDLIEMGFDAEVVKGLPAYTGEGYDSGREDARYQDERYGGADRELSSVQPSQDLIALNEEYIRVDYDGDGIAELRKVFRVHDTILLNEEVEESPFSLLCPVPMPHKVYGLSLADQVLDLQRISSVLWRQTLDNLYKSNNPRPVIPEGAERTDGSTLDSLADSAPGAAIYEGRASIRFEAVPFVADKSFPMLEFTQQQQEERTGVSRAGQGLDTNALKKSGQMTATEMAMIQGGKNARVEMIARIFAETGVKRLFKSILRLVVRHQPRERMIRLRNTWVEVDPRGWNPDMDLQISVGLGVGDKTEQMAQASGVLDTMERVSASPFAALVSPEKVYNALKRFYHASGIKNVDEYLVDPEQMPEQQEKPDPEMAKVEAEAQQAAAKLQGEQQLAQMKLQLQAEEQAQKQQLAREQAEFEAQLAREKTALEIELAREKMAMEAELSREQAKLKAETDTQISRNRPGGDLSE